MKHDPRSIYPGTQFYGAVPSPGSTGMNMNPNANVMSYGQFVTPSVAPMANAATNLVTPGAPQHHPLSSVFGIG